jgi:photosystem II stability/assembly factor-like uncharacterized protein
MISRLILLLSLTLVAQSASAAWVKQRSPTFSRLLDIAFVSDSKGFIGGAGGTFLETSDGGATWEKRRELTSDTIRQIHFSDGSNGWLLCERDIYNRGTQSSSYVLKTTDGGLNWEKIEFGSETRDRITRILFNAKGAGFAIGEKGAIFEYLPERGAWERQSTAIKYLLLAGTFAGERDATLVGAAGSVYFTDNGGSTWSGATVAGNPDVKFNSVFFLNRSAGWIAGGSGAIFQTQSGGRTWRAQVSGVSSDLSDIRFLNSAEGFAVGADGTILHTTTAGNVWNTERSGIKHRLERIGVNGRRVFAVGFGGTILTNDGGSGPKLK